MRINEKSLEIYRKFMDEMGPQYLLDIEILMGIHDYDYIDELNILNKEEELEAANIILTCYVKDQSESRLDDIIYAVLDNYKEIQNKKLSYRDILTTYL